MKKQNFGIRTKARPVTLARAQLEQMTEDQLGWQINDACKKMGWHFLWLRKTYNSSEGILDLMLVPLRQRVHQGQLDPPILHRELKGHDRRGRLGKPTDAQLTTIALINGAGGNAAVWEPADWFSGKILEELR